MGALPRPTVAAGPVRRLFDALHELHHRAGWPSLREMAKEVGCSHTTVSVAFSEPRVPRWGLLELIVETLDGDTERFHELWLAASRAEKEFPSPPVEPVAARAVLPRHLPADVFGFTARSRQLAELDELLAEIRGGSAAMVIALICGTAGVGKTALAVHWGHRLAHRFPAGQLYVDLHGYGPDRPVEPAEALAGFLRTLGQDDDAVPRATAERAARYRTLVSGRRMLILLDNAHSVEQVRELLPGTASCFVVVTSRHSLPALVARHGARRISLELFSPSDSVALLRGLVGARVDAEPEQAATLAWRCARLPLALRIAAELATSRPAATLGDLAAELADERGRLDLLDTGEDEHTALRALFLSSYRRLAPPVAQAFALLGVHPGRDIDPPAFAALLGGDAPGAHRTLDALARAHLVQEARPGRFGMHDLLRVYAAEQAAALPVAERAAALTRLFAYYLDMAVDAAAAYERPAPPGGGGTAPLAGPDAARAWLEGERTNLLAVSEAAVGLGGAASEDADRVDVSRLAATLAGWLDASAHYEDALTMHGLAARAARDDGDVAGEAAALGRLATVHRRLGDYPTAQRRYEEALRGHQRSGDLAGAADDRHGLGIVDWRLGRYDRALVHLGEALAVRRQLADRAGEAASRYSLGIVSRRLGRYDQAQVHYEDALAIYREIGDRAGEARTLGNLGIVHERLGHLDTALEQHQQSLAIHLELGDRAGEAVCLTNLGACHTRRGDCSAALDQHQRALAIYRQIGYRVGEADALHGIGVAHRQAGRLDRALPALREAVAVGSAIGELDIYTQALNDLGLALTRAGHPGEAATRHHDAFGLAETSGDRYEQARALDGIARVHEHTGDAVQALRFLERAARLFADLGVPEAADARQRLATLAARSPTSRA